MKEILNSHNLKTLRAEVKKTNIKGYSTMKKSVLISKMLEPKHRDNFKHIKMAGKKVIVKKATPKPKPKPAPAPKPKAPKPPPRPEPKISPSVLRIVNRIKEGHKNRQKLNVPELFKLIKTYNDTIGKDKNNKLVKKEIEDIREEKIKKEKALKEKKKPATTLPKIPKSLLSKEAFNIQSSPAVKQVKVSIGSDRKKYFDFLLTDDLQNTFQNQVIPELERDGEVKDRDLIDLKYDEEYTVKDFKMIIKAIKKFKNKKENK